MSLGRLRPLLLVLVGLVVLAAGSAQAAGPNSGANAALIQPDGKIVAVGWGETASWGLPAAVGLARYTPSGFLDRSFGSGGLAATGYGTWPRDVYGAAAALQANGKIVVAGAARNGFELLRYKPNGSLDTTFGTRGEVRTAFGSLVAEARAAAIQPDGKIVVAGALSVGGRGGTAAGFGLARYEANGSLDTSFGTVGRVTTLIGGGGRASALALQATGKIVAAGSYSGGFALTRYDADGSLDASFGSGGVVTTPVAGPDAGAAAVALQPDGKLVAVGSGHTISYYNSSFVLVRYEQDGSLDPSFGMGGIVSTAFVDVMNCELCGDQAHALAVQPDGKILAAGETCRGPCNFALARYDPDGSLDASFGSGGKVTSSSGYSASCSNQGGDIAKAVGLQADGKIVLAGSSNFGKCSPDYYVFALARYTPDGSLDASFGGKGIVNTSVQACVVPRLHGESLAWAKSSAKRSNCTFGKVSKAPSHTVAKGRIVSQQPAACSVRGPKATFAVTVSTGSRRGISRPTHLGPIAFDSVSHLGCGGGGSGSSGIYVVEPDGSGRMRLTGQNAVMPAWSPNGRQIAYSAGGNVGNVYLMNADGSHVRLVVKGFAVSPVLSPNGKRLAYRTRSGIWTARTDGKDKRKIVVGGPGFPTWSPDGRKIAYVERTTIHTVSAKGGTPKAVPRVRDVYSVTWAPRGARAVALVDSEAGWGLRVVDLSTGSSHGVATNVDADARPAWSPDGKRIAYVRYGQTSQELVTVKAAGGGLRVVTRMIGDPHGISWRAHH